MYLCHRKPKLGPESLCKTKNIECLFNMHGGRGIINVRMKM